MNTVHQKGRCAAYADQHLAQQHGAVARRQRRQ